MTRSTATKWIVPGFTYLGMRFVNGRTLFHPGPNGETAGVTFIAPRDGDYRFVGKFQITARCGNGIIAEANGIRAPLVDGDLPFSFTKRLSRGETASFVVDPNRDAGCDETSIELTVDRQ